MIVFFQHQQESYDLTSNVFNERLLCNRTIFQNLSQFVRNLIANYLTILLLAFSSKMVLSKKHLISMVLINVLLINCGCVNARPNLETNLIDSNDKTNVRIFNFSVFMIIENNFNFIWCIVSITITITRTS